MEEERLRAEAERLRAWEEEVRAASDRQAQELEHIRADRVAIAERIARAEESVRLGEQRLRLEVERIVSERAMAQPVAVARSRNWLPNAVLALVVLAQGYLLAANIHAGHREARVSAEIEAVTDRVDRAHSDLDTLSRDVHEVREAQRSAPAAGVPAAPSKEPAVKKRKPVKRRRGNRRRGPKTPKSPENGGKIGEDCDFDSPLC